MAESVNRDRLDETRLLRPLFWAYLAALLPHLFHLPWWVILGCLGLWGYALNGPRLGWPPFNRRFLAVPALAGVAGLVLTYGGLLTMETGTGAAAILLALKPFEIRTYRDRIITLLGIYFLLLARVFISQGLGLTLYMVLAVLFIQTIMTRILRQGEPFLSQLRISAWIMVQALPLVVVLFLLFPRVPVGLGFSTTAAQVGFSDTLNPGDVNRIVQNDDIAFRVSFKGEVPAFDRLYWRGLVFLDFDGESWHSGNRRHWLNSEIGPGDQPDYTIIMEPHGHKWLFVLDWPMKIPAWTRLFTDFTVQTYRPVSSTISVDITSNHAFIEGPPGIGNSRTRSLPAQGNPEARRLAKTWADRTRSPEGIMALAERFFKANGFRYTLSPGRLPRDNGVDAFLFQSKKGFCGHFASAYCFLMRAAGVPARIVGGYMGGRINPIGGYLVVRQSDAHAWVEVLGSGQTWVRVDPTAMIAPRRLSPDWEAADLDQTRLVDGTATKTRDWYALPLETLGQVWDTAAFSWDRFALGFSHSRQKRMMQRLGIRKSGWAGQLLVLFIGAVLVVFWGYLLVWLYRFKKPGPRPDRAPALYRRFTDKLGRVGIEHQPHQGPVDFARGVAKVRPDLEIPVLEITRIYIALRYEEHPNDHDISRLKRAIRRFHPAKTRLEKAL